MPAKPHKDLFALEEDKLREIDRRLARGDTAQDVAAFIRKEWGLFKNMVPTTVAKKLSRYRKDVVEGRVAKSLTKSGMMKDLVRLKENINAMEELENLFIIQTDRMKKALNTENQMPNLTTKVAREEVLVCHRILTDLARVQLETGVLQRAPKEYVGEVEEEEEGVLKFRVTEKMKGAIDLFRNAKDVEYVEADG